MNRLVSGGIADPDRREAVGYGDQAAVGEHRFAFGTNRI